MLLTKNIVDPHHSTIKTWLGAFRNVWVHLVPFRYHTKLGAKRAESEQLCEDSCHEVASEFFAMNAPNPHHWTLNSCFSAFSTVWVYLRPFRYCMKLGAKWAEQEQLYEGSCHEVASEFFAMNYPIHTIGP